MIFEHYAYVLPNQLLFKEIYYGLPDAVSHWMRLQECGNFPAYLHDFLPWVRDEAVVDISEPSCLDINVLKRWNETCEFKR